MRQPRTFFIFIMLKENNQKVLHGHENLNFKKNNRMKHLKNSIAILIFFAGTLLSQNESSKWYFGSYAGLDFMTSPPTILTNGAMSTIEGCSSIADGAGNLLFYTSGNTVWNKMHQVMANGNTLYGSASSSQAAIIVPQPGSTSLYYIFTTDAFAGGFGLQYSIVDMSLAAGMGSVTVKNQILYAPTTEKLTAVRHCNGKDIWVITHDWSNNHFIAYLVTGFGLNLIPITSAVGTVHGGNTANAVGCMKASPNGKKLGLGISYAAAFELYDFDNSTGIVSNPLVLSTNVYQAYGCEFSSDGTKFYAAGWAVNIYQWDLCAGSNSAIVASQYTVTTAGLPKGSLQLGPDGKIYVAKLSGGSLLGVISSPNLFGSACNYQDSLQSIFPKTSSYGLPNFVAGYNKQLPAPFSYTFNPAISCLTASFAAPPLPSVNGTCSASSYTYSGINWIFGDPLSGVSNTTSASNPIHAFSGPGTFTVKLVFNAYCGADTMQQVITLPFPNVTVGGFAPLCPGQTVSLTAAGANSYSLNGISTNTLIVLSPSTTTSYTLAGANIFNTCIDTTIFSVQVNAAPVLHVTGNATLCAGNACTLNVSGANTYSLNGQSANNPVVITPTITSTCTLTGAFSSNGCSTSTIALLTVLNCTGIDVRKLNTEGLKIYPNPVKDFLVVETETPLQIVIYNQLGTKIYEGKYLSGTFELDMRTYLHGIYFVKCASEKSTETFKIIRQE